MNHIKTIFRTGLLLVTLASCQQKGDKDQMELEEIDQPIMIKVQEEKFDMVDDTAVFNSATIENFDNQGNSIDVYWIGKDRDTTLRFYRTYDADQNLIGARYYEQGDIAPTLDTVYYNDEGLKVEASMNDQKEITWKSTQYVDDRGNQVLSRYQNGNGDYRGLDSLFYDNQDRVIKGFYENAYGKRYSIKTYNYLKSDEYGNWIERQMFKNDTLSQLQLRTIEYSE